jgi:hypothetical protein
MWVADENGKRKKKSILLIDVVHDKNMEKLHQLLAIDVYRKWVGFFFQLI